ncbi:glycosyltransferase [Levilactobacillus bambusae]|uniref:Glycosyltransferase family 1 protein n=1 Tax=Levilactobacillus bambusae TaxID=2024736 RepID=A0A2V1MXV0_9LACO|nr:glycosyltransferase [Levilactobacillus bambusae]PWF99661.1 hypothetical protein DCM90_07545 [Levilactobacillus bambusae]
MKRLKVLYFVDTLAAGGIQTLMQQTIAQFDPAEIEVTILTLDQTTDRDMADKFGPDVAIHRLPNPMKTPLDLLRLSQQARRYFKQSADYDVLHAHASSKCVGVLRAAKRAGIPVRIIHAHNTAFFTDSQIKQWLGTAMKPALQRVVTTRFACSNQAGRWLFGTHDFTVIPNAIHLDRLEYAAATRKRVRQAEGLADKTVLGHFGSFSPAKNHHQLLQIFARYHQKHDDAILMLVGSGDLMPQIRTEIQNLGLSDAVRLMGYRTDVADLLQATDVLLLPSLHEGLPVVLLEAQAAGVPCVVSTAVDSVAKISDHYQVVALDADMAVWINRIEQASRMPAASRHQGRWQVQRAGYDVTQAAPDLLARYRELLAH